MESHRVNLPRFSKGKRPQFFNEEGVEHLLAMVLELSTELAAAYSRIDRLERIMVADGVTSQERLDRYEPDDEAVNAQSEWSDLFLDRLFSSVQQTSNAD